jgi:hypothetical protein
MTHLREEVHAFGVPTALERESMLVERLLPRPPC